VDHATADILRALRLKKRRPVLIPQPETLFTLLQHPELSEGREDNVHRPRVETELPGDVLRLTAPVGHGPQQTVPDRHTQEDGPPPIELRVVQDLTGLSRSTGIEKRL
jgi:hypothetical protein